MESSYIDRILNNDTLREVLETLKADTFAYNLVSRDWRKDLENYDVYQRHRDGKVKYSKGHACGAEKKAFVRNIVHSRDCFNIVVAGEWILTKSEAEDYSVVVKNCDVLDLIGSSMREDEDKKLHSGGRFFVKDCHPLMCNDCATYHKDYNVPFGRKNWCVNSVVIYNGKDLSRTCANVIQDTLMHLSSFMGIFHMEIYSRTTFGDNSYKIGGTISKMIVFQSSSLIPPRNVVFLPPPTDNRSPAIEYPAAEEVIEER